jgi:hypothetical protein
MSGRNWSNIDPVAYFNEKYAGRVNTRAELEKLDNGLYLKLCRIGKITEVIPTCRRTLKGVDLVQYFKDNYEGKITTRKQLSDIDTHLYDRLRKQKLLDVVLPSSRNRDWTKIDPLELLAKEYPDIKSRTELAKRDPGLCSHLKKIGKLDEVLPSSQPTYRRWKKNDPVKYFMKHHAGTITTRKQLELADKYLYTTLLKTGRINEVLDSKYDDNRDWTKMDVLQYFKENYEGKVTSSKQLRKEDSTVFYALWRLGKLRELFPDTRTQRDWTKIDPVQEFMRLHQGTVKTRSQLQKADGMLYNKLNESGLLDKLFPKNGALDDILRDYADGDS